MSTRRNPIPAAFDAPLEAPKDCALCPRLVAYRDACARDNPDWFNGAVPSFGEDNARLLVVGLAPGVTGANRTGRPFTGDYAGDLLYATLAKFDFSTGVYAGHAADGLALKDTMITNAVRCVPPQNKPTGAEVKACRPFLVARIAALPKLKVLVALGKVAHDSTIAALGPQYGVKQKDAPFGHANAHALGPYTLLDSYHCSRYNTNTGRLTAPMFEAVFATASELLRG